ncbi:hypothetical protein [Stutzerimonas nitrititolerans]|uniref:hypothetical protein n=1 Tax=Stutzerimonas nitrititolerans TaxID=2482751 RepID=UPI0028AF4726|nr:hypothetical protein [Stutzerimonas nitrititolerans]
MAQHTITISDEGGGLSIRVEGDSALESSASGRIAKVLASVAEQAAKAFMAGGCPCPKCQARREAAGQDAESKPTLH